MNIAVFTHNYPKGKDDRKDAGIFIYDFVNELKKYHKVYVFCPEYGNSQKFGNWSFYNPLNIFKFFKSMRYGIQESDKFVREKNINYILSAWALPSGIYAYVIKNRYKIPYGIWYLGSDLNIYSKIPVLGTLVKIVSKNADNLFANSYALSKIASQKYKKCVMMPASTKVDDVKYKSKNVKLDNKKINILFVGRLEKIKGPDFLVEASKKLNNKYQINIIGDGTMRSALEKDKDYKVNFLGYLGLEDMTAYMKSSDILVIPSRNESLPLVLLEAANYKLPVLASDVGDCKYILNKYNIGTTFSCGDTISLIHKISKFKYKKFRTKGKFSKLIIDYSLEVSVKRFINGFKKTVKFI